MSNDANGNDPGSGDSPGGFLGLDDFSDMPLAIDNSDPIQPCLNGPTKCDGDHTNNIFWREGAPGYQGQCILDQMDFEQLFVVLQRVPKAQEDLLRITTDPILQKLARETKLAGTEQDDNKRVADMINKGHGTGAGTLPYYTVLRGNTDGSI